MTPLPPTLECIRNMLRLLPCILIWISSVVAASEPPLVAVASNLTQAVTEIANRFEANSGIKVKLSFGSSGNFARQILQGAPFQLFLSADKKYLDLLTDAGRQLVRITEYARGRIGFFIPSDSKLTGVTDLDSIINTLKFDNYRRLVIANPDHAPYGLAARQALEGAGVWIVSQEKLVLGENIAQAVQFSISGAVDIGIIPESSTLLPEVSNKGRYIPIPETWHQPIQQYLAQLSDTNPNAIRFYDYLLMQESREILIEYGYTPSTLNNE